MPAVRAYRELVLACQLAADCQGIGLAAWIRRTLAAEAGRELRRRQYRVPRRVLDLAAAGRLEQLEQLAATLRAGDLEEPVSAPVPTPPAPSSAEYSPPPDQTQRGESGRYARTKTLSFI